MEATGTASWSSSARVFSHLFYLLSRHTYIYIDEQLWGARSHGTLSIVGRGGIDFRGKRGREKRGCPPTVIRDSAAVAPRTCWRWASFFSLPFSRDIDVVRVAQKREKAPPLSPKSSIFPSRCRAGVKFASSILARGLLRSSVRHKFKWVPSRRVRSCILIHGSVHMHSNRVRSVHMHRSSAHEYAGILHSLDRASFATHAINVF